MLCYYSDFISKYVIVPTVKAIINIVNVIIIKINLWIYSTLHYWVWKKEKESGDCFERELN